MRRTNMTDHQDESPSSFIGLSNVADYSYQRTRAAKNAEYAIRSLHEAVREHVTIQAVQRCFPYKVGRPWPPLAIERFKSGQLFLERCQNKNACPTCARANDAATRKRFCYEFDDHIGYGYQPYWQTLEAGFRKSLTGRKRVASMNALWRKIQQTQKFRAQVKDGRIVSLRVTEFTLRSRVWTPHFHVIWLFRSDVLPDEVTSFLDLVQSLWRKHQAKDAACTSAKPDIHSEPLDPASTINLGRYLFKAFYLEVNASGVNIPDEPKTPLDYLVHYALNGDMDALDYWNAYEAVSSNARRYKFSTGWTKALNSRKSAISNYE